MMKKIIALFLVMVMMSTTTACSVPETWHSDESVDAYAEITTSIGMAYTIPACRYTNNVWTGLASTLESPFVLNLPEGTTATVCFSCVQCGHAETLEFQAPAAHVFSCDCITGDDTEGCTEYLAITLLTGEAPTEVAE